jgi:iron-sulfur cluster assembly accessory protein
MLEATGIGTQLTPAATAFLRRLSRFSAGTEAGVKLVVARGGCSGFTTAFDLASRPEAGDFVWECEGLRIFLGPESRTLLDGATVDFAETASQTGFIIKTQGPAPAACASLPKLVSIGSLVAGQRDQSGRASYGTGS